MALDEALLELAGSASNTLVAIATTGAWNGAKRILARVLGRDEPERIGLQETQERLTRASGLELERECARLEVLWRLRLIDLLEENPEAAKLLRDFAEQFRFGRDRPAATPVAGSPSQPVHLLPRPTYLEGREDLLQEVHARLVPAVGAQPRMVALCGLGGSGKTSVAVEYAYRHLPELGVVWQFSAADEQALRAGFNELALQLGLRHPLDAADPVTQVHGTLTARPGDWLLLFDNVPDPIAIRDMLPPAGRGRVLITSQNPYWPNPWALDVPVLDQDVAASFMMSRTNSTDMAGARDLADELGGLPLALEQAAAYMQATGRSVADYLTLLRERPTDLLRRKGVTGYDKLVSTTWELAFEQLKTASAEAVSLMRLLACYAPERIPIRRLLRSRPGAAASLLSKVAPPLTPLMEDDLVADDAVTALRQYSLIGPMESGLVSVHRLVQTVTLDQMPAQETQAWRAAAQCLLEAALPADTQQPQSWPVYADLLPHALVASPADSEAMERFARYLGNSGSRVAARRLQQQVVDAREQALGAEHPDTLAALAELARWIGGTGDSAAARTQLAGLLPVCTRVLGADSAVTLAVRAGLASWTGEAGEPAGARDQFADLLPISVRVMGPEHQATLAVRASLASWTGQAGDPSAAREQYERLLPDYERVMGSEHPQTLAAGVGDARWAGEAGARATARDRYRRLLPVCERVLGLEHPDTLAARMGLASWTGQAGDPEAARDQYAELLATCERVLGAKHPGTLSVRTGLASWTGQAGDPAAARDHMSRLVPVCQEGLGAEHPATLAAQVGLASWTGQAGDWVTARDRMSRLVPVCERVRGTDHPSTLAARDSLAHWTGKAGDPLAARDQYERLLPVCEQVLGAEHPVTVSVRANHASWAARAASQ